VIVKHLLPPNKPKQRIRYWCIDETRLGLKTISGKVITLKGVKPVGMNQWGRENFYLYGAVEPLTGESFFLEFTHLDGVCFERFVQEFATAYPEDFHILQMDNGKFHDSQQLQIPENVIFLFQPPHTPEVNPIERLWLEIKRGLRWECFSSLEELRVALRKELKKLSKEIVASVTGYEFIIDALLVLDIS
jgi:transposase